MREILPACMFISEGANILCHFGAQIVNLVGIDLYCFLYSVYRCFPMFGNVLPSAARATDLVCPSGKQLTICMCMSLYMVA